MLVSFWMKVVKKEGYVDVQSFYFLRVLETDETTLNLDHSNHPLARKLLPNLSLY